MASSFLISLVGYSQNSTISVEKNNVNVQTGLLGLWINNEFRLSNTIALRAEVGLNAGIFGGDSFNDGTGFLLAPSVGIEPRWYYNLNKRFEKGKRVENNSANFFATGITYYPDSFVISNYDDVNIVEQVTIIPKWGIRRNIGQSNFNYELGAGLGYRAVFYDFKTESETALDLHLRIGYAF